MKPNNNFTQQQQLYQQQQQQQQNRRPQILTDLEKEQKVLEHLVKEQIDKYKNAPLQFQQFDEIMKQQKTEFEKQFEISQVESSLNKISLLNYNKNVNEEEDIQYEKEVQYILREEKVYELPKQDNLSAIRLQFSPHFLSLFLVLYDNWEQQENFISFVNLWNQNENEMPLSKLSNNDKKITSIIFSPFENNILVGGSENGQILLWNTKEISNSDTLKPYKYSKISQIQELPILNLGAFKIQDQNILICVQFTMISAWNLDNLEEPLCKIDLGEKNIQVSYAQFLKQKQLILLGTLDGKIYKISIKQEQGVFEKLQLEEEEYQQFHYSSISSISYNNYDNEKSPLCSHLTISSAMDNSIKLYNIDNFKKCLISINTVDPILDLKFNPKNPFLYATCDIKGRICIYNLLDENKQIPLKRLFANRQNTGVEQLAWNHEGTYLVAGDSEGIIHLYKLQDSYLSYTQYDVNQFENWINEQQ